MTALVAYPHEWRRRSVAVADCLAIGAGGRLAGEAEMLSGVLAAGPVVLHGCSPVTAPLLAAARRAADRPWWYADKGYFGRRSMVRVTRGRLQHDGFSGGARADRLRDLGVDIAPWRHGGRHVLVCLQSEQWMRDAEELSRRDWLAWVLALLALATDREIRVRTKRPPDGIEHRPLAADLADCWAVVTHTSNCAVEALVAGVPVFITGNSAASPMAAGPISAIETPCRPDGREEWAARLAANQWTLDELAAGDWWRQVGEG
ncbi:hypothetical protein EDC65_2248 [Stella humosa]|uniref:Uncharacterized protein n=1 Tax=Stella humosa TaxID=94 RepID=A0A3N1MB19_9PROT|nr:hypothetical protein [Stella humosa]ROQ00449.1 hypothetical protein EDC65_2248 [Stella humosa]BBK30306.1 hypothetical protein STHU_09400 [Stella humosa]